MFQWYEYIAALGFPGGSDGKASAYNPGDLGSIPGSGRSPGEGNGSSLQYSCLGDSTDKGASRTIVHGVPESDTTERLNNNVFLERRWELSLVRRAHGFPGGSDGKRSACSAGDQGSIPGLGRSPGEGKGYPCQ